MASPFQLAASRQTPPGLPARPGGTLPTITPRRRPVRAIQPSAAFASAIERTADTRDDKPRSFLGQIKDTFTGVIPGVVGIGKSLAVGATAPVRAFVDYTQGELSGAEALSAGTFADSLLGLAGNDAAQRRNERYNPLADQLGDSVKTTGGRIRHPSRYGDAIDEGRIVDAILEDAGNVALVGGIASKALGAGASSAAASGNAARAASLERAANIAERIATPLDRVGDAPFSVPRRVVRGVRGGIVRGFENARAGKYGLGAQERAVSLSSRLPAALTSETGAFLAPAARKAEREARRAQTKVERRLYQGASEGNLSVAEQGAVTAVRTGLAQQVDNLVRQGIAPEEALRMTTLRNIPEQTLTPEVNEVALAYLRRELPPEDLARLDEYARVVDETIGQNTQRALEGSGRPGGPLDPRQIGDEPLWDRVDQMMRDAGGKGVDPDTGMLLDPADAPLLQSILDTPDAYPAPWRPSMRSAGLARRAAAEAGASLAIPLRPSEMLDAGMERPRYLPGGRSDLADPLSAKAGRTPIREGIRGVQGVRSEKMRAVGEIQPFSARTIAEKAGSEARTTVMNERLVEMFNDPRIKTVRDMIPEERRADLMDAARREAEAQGGTPQQIATRTQEFYGQNLLDELKTEWRHDVLLGDRANPQVGDFDPNDASTFARIGDDSVVLPAGLKDRLIPYMRGKDMGRFFSTLAKINSKFKGAVLPFSIRWQLGDAVGGAFMAAVGGGIRPDELFRSMTQLKRLDEPAVRAIFDDLQDSGLNLEEARWMRGDSELGTPTTKVGKAWRRGGDIRRASFRLNEWINRMNRQGYALAKLQKIMDERSLSFEDALQSKAWDDPEVQRAISDAVDDANNVMGTFDEMTPFERNYVRNVFPFWAWNRHITQLAWRTAIDNPSRMMWTLRLGSYGADQNDADLLPWQAGSVVVGDRLIPTNFVNPFNDVGGGSIYTPTGAARSLSPGLKLLAAAVGKDANRGFADITRAYDGGGLDELGRPGGFRLLSPAELAYQAIRQVPQGRALLNVLPTGEVANVGLGPHPRYGSGEFMVNRRGQPIDTDSRLQSLFGLVGLQGTGDMPLLGSLADNEQILSARDARIREAQRRAANTIRFEG